MARHSLFVLKVLLYPNQALVKVCPMSVVAWDMLQLYQNS